MGTGRKTTVRFRWDTPDRQGSHQEAIYAFLSAVQKIVPAVFTELRDLPPHEMEGPHVCEAKDQRLYAEASATGIGKFFLLTALPADQTRQVVGAGRITGANVLDDDLGAFVEPAMMVFVPRATVELAKKWHLSTPRIEATLALLRFQWRRRPNAARRCKLVFSALPTMLRDATVSLPSEAQWTKSRAPAVPPNPMVESEREYLERAAAEYRKREEAYYRRSGRRAGARAFVPRHRSPDLDQHSQWLARRQVLAEPWSAIAKAHGVTTDAVRKAVSRLAKTLGLRLPVRRRGRPRRTTRNMDK